MTDKRIRIILDAKNAQSAAKKTDESISGIGRSADNAQFSVNKLAAAISGLIAAAKFGQFISDSIRVTKEFERSLSELSAITGATGDDLKFLGDAAKEFGATTTLSASQAVNALKLIASAKPDLLENAEALKQVTREAIALAEAAGIDLPQAADTLGTSLNQFAADASEAGRFINVLAAGAKFGSSEIANTAEALKNAGVSAAAANISFEETNAAIQLLATSGLKGAEAGTGLRNVISILDTNIKTSFRPSVVGLEQALRNVNDANLDATEFVKIFGRENQNAARILLNQVDNLDELTAKLTGTNTAYEQASTNTNNLDGDVKALASSYEALQLTVGGLFTGAARTATQEATDAIRALNDNMDNILSVVEALAVLFGARLAVAVGASAAAFVAQNAAMLKATVTMNAMGQVIARTTVANNLLAASSRAAGASMALLGGPAGVVILAATALIYFADKAQETRTESELLEAQIDKVTEAYRGLDEQATKNQISELGRQAESVKKEMELLAEKIREASDRARRANQISMQSGSTAADGVRGLRSEYDSLDNKLKVLIGTQERLRKSIEDPYDFNGADPFESVGGPSQPTAGSGDIVSGSSVKESDIGRQEIAQAQNITKQLQNELNLRIQIADIYRQKTLSADETLYEQQLAAIAAREAEELARLQAKAVEDQIRRDEQFRQALENEKLQEEERIILREEQAAQQLLAEQILEQERTAILQEGIDARQQLREAEKQMAISTALSLGGQLMTLAQGQSKRAFEFSKKAALASAIISGGKAAVDAWSAGMSTGGPWAPAVAAAYTAASLLQTGNLIKNIRGQSFSGGGGSGGSTVSAGSAIGGGGGGGSQIPSTVNTPELTQQRRIIEIRGMSPGDLLTGEQVASIFESDDSVIVAFENAREDAQRRNVIGVTAR